MIRCSITQTMTKLLQPIHRTALHVLLTAGVEASERFERLGEDEWGRWEWARGVPTSLQVGRSVDRVRC